LVLRWFEKQIPYGNDSKKGKCNDNSNGKSKYNNSKS